MIKVKTFVFNNLQVNSFVLYDETMNALLIDPACQTKQETEKLTGFITSNNLNPIAMAITHGHVDHIVGINYCIEKYHLSYQMHADDFSLLGSAREMGLFFGFDINTIIPPEKFIKEGDKIHFGNSALEIIHIPGHSPGSILFYSPSDNFLIAGDVLFSGSIGRTDLPGGDYQSLITGIKQKLFTLPPATVVYPGHGPSTTIMEELSSNPYLN